MINDRHFFSQFKHLNNHHLQLFSHVKFLHEQTLGLSWGTSVNLFTFVPLTKVWGHLQRYFKINFPRPVIEFIELWIIQL